MIRFGLTACIFLFLVPKLPAQTAGISEVTQVESLAKEYPGIQTEIARLKRLIAEQAAKKNQPLDKVRKEIKDLEIERDKIIADMKVGARCSQCKEWKSNFEKRGINFQQHLGEVKGYAIPATTSELEATRTSYREKIAYKKVQLKRLEESLNVPSAEDKRLKTLQDKSNNMCAEMRKLIRSYDKKVQASGKSQHEDWMMGLMKPVIQILIQSDREAIAVHRQKESRQAFEKRQQEIKEEMAERLATRKRTTELSLAEVETAIESLTANWQKNERGLLEKIRESNSALEKAQEELRKATTDSSKQYWQPVYDRALEENKAHKQSHASQQKNYEENLNRRKELLSKIKTEWNAFLINHPKVEQAAIQKAKAQFDAELKKYQQEENAARLKQREANQEYSRQKAFYESKQQSLYNTIRSEENRMGVAGSSIQCNNYFETAGAVQSNWSNFLGCVGSVKSFAKSNRSHVFNSYCGEYKADKSLSDYLSFLSSLPDSDRKAVQEISNPLWLKKLTGWEY